MVAINSDIGKESLRKGGLTLSLCLITSFILPVYVHLLPPFLILWVLCWLFENGHDLKKIFSIRNRSAFLFFLFIIFFLWQLSGLLQAESINIGIERMVKRLPFILFPLVLFYPGDRITKNIDLITVSYTHLDVYKRQIL